MSSPVKPPRISSEQYRYLTIGACFFIAAIVVTGASVRVTGSGLGCPTWPKCTSDSLIPKSSETSHASIEFANRVFTGLLSLSVIVAVGASFLRDPKSKTLRWLSFGLVVGVIAQIVLGGITVLLDLHPLSVGAHMLLSCLLLSCAVVLAVVSRRKRPPSLKNLFAKNRQLLISVETLVVVVLGIVVTAAGPHAGDERTPRLDVSVQTVARIHSASAWLLLGTVIYLIYLKKDNTPSLKFLAGVIVIQGGWGYAQYLAGVPSWMALTHVFFATILYIMANLYWTTSIQSRRQISQEKDLLEVGLS